MSYKGYLAAQMKYDNMLPDDGDGYETEEDSGSSDIEDDAIDYLEDMQREAIERDYQRFLDHLYNTTKD